MSRILGCRELVNEMGRIKFGHDHAVVMRTARLVLGSSVIRVYNKGSKEPMLEVLCTFPVEQLRRVRSWRAFKRLYERQLARVLRVVSRTNRGRNRLGEGIKWGHCAKVLSIFMRDLVLRSRLFTDEEVRRLAPMLCVPFDSIVFSRLRGTCGVRDAPRKLRQLSSGRVFWKLQGRLRDAAGTVGTWAVNFDDVWAEPRKTEH